MAKSIKTNLVYNIINIVNGLLFPLITFPYITRVIMAEGIGQVNFFGSIINYIALFSSLGIPMYGIREIARVRDSKVELTKTTLEILSLNLLFNLFGYIVVLILCSTVSEIQVNIPLFLLLSTTIIMTTLGCSWFYSGIEEFKYITIQGLIVSVISIAFLFIFVRSEEDLMWYGLYTVLGSSCRYLVNFFWLGHHVDFRIVKIKQLSPFRHLKGVLQVFVFNLMTSIYLNLDSVMLGFLSNVTAVGYYAAATKVSHIFVLAISSLGNVLLPRTSNLLKNNKLEEFQHLTQKAMAMVEFICFPVFIGVVVMASILVHIFGGNTFEPSILTLQLVAPTIVAISLSQITGIQILYPIGRINVVTMSTFIGAVVNLLLNFFLIPRFSQYGAAIATSAAEISVLLTQFVFIGRYINFKILDANIFKYIFASLLMGGVCYLITMGTLSELMLLFIIPVIGGLVYISILILMKDRLSKELVEMARNKLFRK